jgi:hypothetical protein
MPGDDKDNGEHHSFMDGLKEKLHGTKLHEAKVALHHRKYAEQCRAGLGSR